MHYIPPIVDRFEYENINRVDIDGLRHYDTSTGKLPSVTTILSATTHNEALENWRNFVGDEAADKIVHQAVSIGTLMHENLERALIGEEYHKGSMPMRVKARQLADMMRENAWININEVWGQEVPLFYPSLWAGTTDIVGIHNCIPTIMDYKNARKPKTWETIETYRMQCAAYALAHNELFDTNIKRGAIFVMVRTDVPQYQEFIIEGGDFTEATDMWLDRVEKYYETKRNL